MSESERELLEIQKLSAEVEKIKAEREVLRRPWWQAASSFAAALGLLGSFGVAWLTTGTKFQGELNQSKIDIERLKSEASAIRTSMPEIDARCTERRTPGAVTVNFSRRFSRLPIVVATQRYPGPVQFQEIVSAVTETTATVSGGNHDPNGAYQFCWYAVVVPATTAR